MRIVKAAVLSLAGLFAVTTAQAAPLISKPATESVITLAQAKKKEEKKAAPKKAAPKKAKKKAASKAGKCGTMNYWDKKKKKCVSAADKK
jgi:topoisomerase IA-like protein